MRLKIDTVSDWLWDANIDVDSLLYKSYSGRYMYGRTCIGIVGSINDFARFITAVAAKDSQMASDLSDAATIDVMGLDTIFYFPGVELE